MYWDSMGKVLLKGGKVAKKRRKVKLISWNCEVGRNPLKVKHAVQHMIWLHHPRFICLQEARGYRAVLRSIRNYEEYSPEGKSREAGDSVTLVRTSTVRQIIT